MEEKGQLKYKVGDRASFEAVISDVDYSRQAPYRFTYRDGSGLWATKEYLEELTDKLPPRPKVPLLFTKSELEEAGFGDVFDNPLFEVDEVVNG